MVKHTVTPEKKEELIKTLHEEIEKRVFNKVKQQHNVNVDVKKIEEECKEAFCKELFDKLMEEIKILPVFFKQGHIDDPEFFDELNASFEKNIKNEKPKSILDEHQPVHSQEQLDKLYSLATKWFNEGDLTKALLYLSYLTLIDAENADNWLARGMTEQALAKYDDALKSYSNSLFFDPQNMMTYINIMNCLILCNRVDNAKQIYDEFNNIADPKLFDEEIKKKLEKIKKYVNGDIVIKH